jgi:hypothetical protein
MTATNNSKDKQTGSGLKKLDQRRRFVMGLIFLGAALFIWLVFTPNAEPGEVSRFVMAPGGSSTVMNDWVLNP